MEESENEIDFAGIGERKEEEEEEENGSQAEMQIERQNDDREFEFNRLSVAEIETKWTELADLLATWKAMEGGDIIQAMYDYLGGPFNSSAQLDEKFLRRLLVPALEYGTQRDLSSTSFTLSPETNRLLADVHNLYNMMSFYFSFQTGDPTTMYNSSKILHDFNPFDFQKGDEKTFMFQWCLAQARRERYRYFEGYVYREVYVDNGRTGTRYWKRIDLIEKVFPTKINPIYHQAINGIYIKFPKIFIDLSNVLQNNHPEFPNVIPKRRLISFHDGIYDLHRDQFFTFDSVPTKYHEDKDEKDQTNPQEYIAAHFVDQYFADAYQHPLSYWMDPIKSWSERQTAYNSNRLIFGGQLDLPTFGPELDTPRFESLMATQNWDWSMRFWFYFMIGRLFHIVGVDDNYQSCLVLYGMTGTGKSEILRVINAFFPFERVAQFENRIEETFGLSVLFGKYLWELQELGTRTNICTSSFKKLMGREPMTLAVKNKNPTPYVPEAHGVITTNTDIGGTGALGRETKGSIPRRLAIFYFHNLPAKRIPIYEKIESEGELPKILRKCNVAYLVGREMIERLTGGDIWKVLPAPVYEQYINTLRKTEWIMDWILSDRQIMTGPECYMQLQDAEQLYWEWRLSATTAANEKKKPKHSSLDWSNYDMVLETLRCVRQRLPIQLKACSDIAPHDIPTSDFISTRFAYRDKNIPSVHIRSIPDCLKQTNSTAADESTKYLTEYIFGIRKGAAAPYRVIPSFIQNRLIHSDNPEQILEIDDIENYVHIYQRDFYHTEQTYMWKKDYFIECARNFGFIIDDSENYIQADYDFVSLV